MGSSVGDMLLPLAPAVAKLPLLKHFTACWQWQCTTGGEAVPAGTAPQKWKVGTKARVAVSVAVGWRNREKARRERNRMEGGWEGGGQGLGGDSDRFCRLCCLLSWEIRQAQMQTQTQVDTLSLL